MVFLVSGGTQEIKLHCSKAFGILQFLAQDPSREVSAERSQENTEWWRALTPNFREVPLPFFSVLLSSFFTGMCIGSICTLL